MKQTLSEIHLNKKALDRSPAPANPSTASAFPYEPFKPPLAIPSEHAFKCFDRMICANHSFLAVAFYQFECAVAASNHEVNLYLLVN
jgi:hypothetical protein